MWLIFNYTSLDSTAKLVINNLIKYNSKVLEKNEDEEKDPIDIEFNEQKADSENDETAIDFKWSDVQGEDEKHIAKVNLI